MRRNLGHNSDMTVNQVLDILPHLSREEVVECLRRNNFSMSGALNELLDG